MKTMTVSEVAQRLGVSTETVRRMIHAGELRADRKRPGLRGSSFLVYEDSVLEIEKKRQRGR